MSCLTQQCMTVSQLNISVKSRQFQVNGRQEILLHMPPTMRSLLSLTPFILTKLMNTSNMNSLLAPHNQSQFARSSSSLDHYLDVTVFLVTNNEGVLFISHQSLPSQSLYHCGRLLKFESRVSFEYLKWAFSMFPAYSVKAWNSRPQNSNS